MRTPQTGERGMFSLPPVVFPTVSYDESEPWPSFWAGFVVVGAAGETPAACLFVPNNVVVRDLRMLVAPTATPAQVVFHAARGAQTVNAIRAIAAWGFVGGVAALQASVQSRCEWGFGGLTVAQNVVLIANAANETRVAVAPSDRLTELVLPPIVGPAALVAKRDNQNTTASIAHLWREQPGP